MKVRALRGVCIGVGRHLKAGDVEDLAPDLVTFLQNIGAVEEVKDEPKAEAKPEPKPEPKAEARRKPGRPPKPKSEPIPAISSPEDKSGGKEK